MMRTYGRLALVDGQWLLSELEPHVAIRLKANFPSVPKHSAGPFRLSAEPIWCAELSWFMERYPLEVRAEDKALLERGRAGFEAIQAEAGRIMAADYQPPLLKGLREGVALKPHQARNVELLGRVGGLLVGDDVGEGKTFTGIGACLLPGALPATVVTLPHLAGQWAERIRANSSLVPHVVKGTKPHMLPGADVRIFGYTQLAGWVDALELLGTGAAIFDEVDDLRHGNESSKGAAGLRLTERARYRLGLSATPTWNYGDEIWNIMRLLRPEVLGEREDFIREWCSGRTVTDPEALGTYLREQYALVRKRGSGPPVNTLVQVIDHDAARLESVEALAHELAVRARHGQWEQRGQAIRELDMLLRQETGLAKAPYVARYVQMLCEAGEPVVLFGWHRGVYDLWLKHFREAGLNPVLYTGTESSGQKDEAKRAFIERRANPLIMSLRSGRGMDGIQAVCRVAVIGELDWTHAVHHQCFGRINRDGQFSWPDRVTGIYLVADDGSDPAIQEVCGIKASQAAGIMDPGLGPEIVDRDGSALERLVLRYMDRGRLAA